MSSQHINDLRPQLLPVEVHALTYAAQGRTLIGEINLTLSSPGITMIMGPNGAGKSLLLRLMNGLVKPAKGTIYFNGEQSSQSLREAQAMVFQKPVLLRRSVRANIDFILKSRALERSRCDALLERVGLIDQQHQPARLLSGGEQQRLALARALAIRPAILYMDEPTASLDPTSVVKIETIVEAIRDSGTKVIFVTHDIGQAKRLADDIVFIHRGCVVEHRLAEDFFNAPESDAAKAYIGGRLYL